MEVKPQLCCEPNPKPPLFPVHGVCPEHPGFPEQGRGAASHRPAAVPLLGWRMHAWLHIHGMCNAFQGPGEHLAVRTASLTSDLHFEQQFWLEDTSDGFINNARTHFQIKNLESGLKKKFNFVVNIFPEGFPCLRLAGAWKGLTMWGHSPDAPQLQIRHWGAICPLRPQGTAAAVTWAFCCDA